MIAETIRFACGLAAKDLRMFLRDKVALALGFLLPIALVTVFGAVMGRMGDDDGGALPKQTIRVADEDQSEASRKFIAALAKSPIAEVLSEQAGKPFTRDSLVERVRKGQAPIGLVIGRGFGEGVARGARPMLEVLRDPSKEMEFRIASQALLPAVMEVTAGRQAKRLPLDIVRSFVGAETFDRSDTSDLERKSADLFDAMSDWADRAAASQPAPRESAAKGGSLASFDFMGTMLGVKDTQVVPENVSVAERRRNIMLAQSVAGTAVMMLLFGLTACGTTILQERDGGTLRRLLITPSPRAAILAGKFLYTFVVGMTQLTVMFVFGAIVFGIRILPHAGPLLLAGAATCAACTGFGLFIATLGRSQKQVEGISTLVILMMSSLGGSWWPLFITPKWMQVAGHFTINAWAMDAFLGILGYEVGLADVLLPLAVLAAIAVVLVGLSVVMFRRRVLTVERGA